MPNLKEFFLNRLGYDDTLYIEQYDELQPMYVLAEVFASEDRYYPTRREVFDANSENGEFNYNNVCGIFCQDTSGKWRYIYMGLVGEEVLLDETFEGKFEEAQEFFKKIVRKRNIGIMEEKMKNFCDSKHWDKINPGPFDADIAINIILEIFPGMDICYIDDAIEPEVDDSGDGEYYGYNVFSRRRSFQKCMILKSDNAYFYVRYLAIESGTVQSYNSPYRDEIEDFDNGCITIDVAIIPGGHEELVEKIIQEEGENHYNIWNRIKNKVGAEIIELSFDDVHGLDKKYNLPSIIDEAEGITEDEPIIVNLDTTNDRDAFDESVLPSTGKSEIV